MEQNLRRITVSFIAKIFHRLNFCGKVYQRRVSARFSLRSLSYGPCHFRLSQFCSLHTLVGGTESSWLDQGKKDSGPSGFFNWNSLNVHCIMSWNYKKAHGAQLYARIFFAVPTRPWKCPKIPENTYTLLCCCTNPHKSLHYCEYLLHLTRLTICHTRVNPSLHTWICCLTCDLYWNWSSMNLWVMFMNIPVPFITVEPSVLLRTPQNWHSNTRVKPPHRTMCMPHILR